MQKTPNIENVSQNLVVLFCKMFPDSKVAENFWCWKSYVVCFVLLASYVKRLLTKSLSNVEHFSFDESFNKTSKRGQMDMHVRYWDNNHNYVATHYYHSEFMGKASAKDVFGSFSACLSGIRESKLLQVSSDGPNVDLLDEDRNEKELSQPVHIGTCDINTSHNSIKHGAKASGWNVKKLL